MATVYIPTLLQPLTGGQSSVAVEGATVRQLIDNLDQAWPGIKDRLLDNGHLRPNLAVAVDGEVSPAGLLEPVAPTSEVHFVAAIKGGCRAAIFLVVLCCTAHAAAPDFIKDVHPIFAEKCFACHSGDKRSGGLVLDSYNDVLKGGRSGAAVIPGESKSSLLIQRVAGEVTPQMPLAGPKLTPAELGVIRAWIDDGARPAPNAARARRPWVPSMSLVAPKPSRSEIFAAYFSAHGEADRQPVSDAIFARRAFLDVWGFTPSPEELEVFLADRGPSKRERLIDRLLADNTRYAENWISFWNDLLRNDEGVNYYGGRKAITSWLLDALETNKPYNRMLTELLDPTEPGDPDGFLIGVNWRGDVSASQTPVMQAAQNSAQVFLGINLKCNSCHDSFISRWKLKDAYSLAAYFSPDEQLELYRCDKPTGDYATPRFLYPDLDRSAAIPHSIAERHAAAARLFTEPANGRMPRTIVNRIWQRLIGRGIVEPVDDMDTEPWSPALLDSLAADFVAHRYDLKHLIAAIMNSPAYQMPSATPAPASEPYVFHGPEIRRLTAEQFADSLSAITGEWRLVVPNNTPRAAYVREWRAIASPLTRALGRPNREQVFTERSNEATMLQALELVNGDTLNHMLLRGAERMLGQWKPAPVALFDSGQLKARSPWRIFSIDLARARELWLVVADDGSYSPDRVRVAWSDMKLIGPGGATPLSNLEPKQTRRNGADSLAVYDLTGKRFTALEGSVAIDRQCTTSEIMPQVRAFVFDRQPDMARLVAPSAEVPVPTVHGPFTREQWIGRIFLQALARQPSDLERRLAEAELASGPPAQSMADLLWSIAMLPEFQMIR